MSITMIPHERSQVGLEYVGLHENKNVLWNLTPAELVEQAIKNNEGILTNDFVLRVLTGTFTGRSPKDKFFVDEPEIKDEIDWGGFNTAISDDIFQNLYRKIKAHLQFKKIFVIDAYAGADPEYRLPIRVISEAAYHALFAHNMFIRPSADDMKSIEPQFTVLAAPSFSADPEEDGTRTGTFIMCSFKHKIIIIGGTLYSGEVKKGIFGVMNYLLPKRGVMPMHCSANVDANGNSTVYFGLSGTGKTTLSADADKTLIGDDEHGWTDNGIFNFEGGCYAKTINLTEESEPMIFETTRTPGTILENVPVNEFRQPVFESKLYTENTRCSYPLSQIPNASSTGLAPHPKNIIYLTADAFGVLPPISKLTPEQAMYYFISGYTAKVAGTERGITEPSATFSACFGAPFMPLHPSVYAELLAEKIQKHNSSVWLVNTGWTGGSYGTGTRMKLAWTRRMLDAATSGELDHVELIKHPIFGLDMPVAVNGVPSGVLNPRSTWADPHAYDTKARELADMFVTNFMKYADQCRPEVVAAGPRV